MKRIAFIINSGLTNAGVPKVTFDIYSAIKNDYDCSFIVEAAHSEYYDKSITDTGGSVFYIGKPLTHGRKRYIYNLTVRQWKLFRIFRKGGFDIIHTATGIESGLDCFIAAIAGIKKRICHSHGVFSFASRNRIEKLYKAICEYLINRCATVCIAVSEKAGHSLFRGREFSVLLNPIDKEKYSPNQPQAHEGINLLQIGYFNLNKNQMFAVDVLKNILDMNIMAKLYFIGYEVEKNYLIKLKEKIRELGLVEYVYFLPHDYDKRKIFPFVDYVLIPSLSEGLPLVALEAQAAHVECVVSDAVPIDVNVGLIHIVQGYNSFEWAWRIATNTFEKIECFHKLEDYSLATFKRQLLRIYEE